VHGFTATPEEVRPLGDALAAAGFPVPRRATAGHGTVVTDLATVSHRQWIATVQDAVRRMEKDVPRVAIAGVSLGALLGLAVAAVGVPPVQALVLLGRRCASPTSAPPRFGSSPGCRGDQPGAARAEAPRARHLDEAARARFGRVRRDAADGRSSSSCACAPA
jgi:pimeloyl-ACP methyl ester carboxylesterase